MCNNPYFSCSIIYFTICKEFFLVKCTFLIYFILSLLFLLEYSFFFSAFLNGSSCKSSDFGNPKSVSDSDILSKHYDISLSCSEKNEWMKTMFVIESQWSFSIETTFHPCNERLKRWNEQGARGVFPRASVCDRHKDPADIIDFPALTNIIYLCQFWFSMNHELHDYNSAFSHLCKKNSLGS